MGGELSSKCVGEAEDSEEQEEYCGESVEGPEWIAGQHTAPQHPAEAASSCNKEERDDAEADSLQGR